MRNEMLNQYVITRGKDSGVFFGILEKRKKQTVILRECRRIWYWDGAASISQLAATGATAPENCKFTMTVDNIILLDVIEIISCTEDAIKNIKDVIEWKR